MGSAARLRGVIALFLALAVAGPEPQAVAIEKDKLVPAGRLVISGRRLSCGNTQTLLRDFEGFAVSSTVIMLNMQALEPAAAPGAMADLLSRMRPHPATGRARPRRIATRCGARGAKAG